jgi:hypothetical protein
MIYRLLGRGLWGIVRGYYRHRFPNARRDLAIAGVAGVAAVAGISAARRRAAAAASQKA